MGKIGELLSDEESVKQLSELAQMFMNGSEGEASAEETKADEELSENVDEQEGSGVDFDFGSLLKFTEIMGAMKDKNSELLLALKPHLKEDRQQRVDKAIKMMKLLAIWNIVRDTGLLKDFL